jgi:hypothetical protein
MHWVGSGEAGGERFFGGAIPRGEGGGALGGVVVHCAGIKLFGMRWTGREMGVCGETAWGTGGKNKVIFLRISRNIYECFERETGTGVKLRVKREKISTE